MLPLVSMRKIDIKIFIYLLGPSPKREYVNQMDNRY